MKHPYENIPDAQRWSRAVAGRADDEIDPVGEMQARIGRNDRVVSAGSCFAQHICRYLESRDYGRFRTETAHPLLRPAVAAEFQYDLYAARYGNIYTTRQLLQLWQRATDEFVPRETYWEHEGAFYDPFRPTIQPGGFLTLEELEVERAQHLGAVVKAFSTMDVLIFTLGLTECWTSAEDGAVYPLCPGVVCGEFQPGHHVKRNFTAEEIKHDLCAFIDAVRRVNPALRVILTVSPQPHMITTERRHIVTEVAYAKARLRVAAEQACEMADVDYFPSFELATLPGSSYFEQDRRTVGQRGIDRAMELFSEHVLDATANDQPAAEAQRYEQPSSETFIEDAARLVRILCDEDFLEGRGEDVTRSIARRMLEGSKPTSPLLEDDELLIRARTLAIEKRYSEALSIVKELHERKPRPALRYLIERWKRDVETSP